MTWEQFYYAMMRGFLDLGLITSRIYEHGSSKRRYYSRKMILASAYIRIIKDYIPCEKDEDGNGVHHLTADQMRKVTNNLNGLFGTQYYFNFDEPCVVGPTSFTMTLDVGYQDIGILEMAGTNLIVDWGDGSATESYPTGISTQVNHTYTGTVYPTTVTYDTLTTVHLLSEIGLLSIDLSGLVDITVLNLGSTSLPSIDISNNIQLEELVVINSGLTSVSISSNSKLTTIDLNSNSLTGNVMDSILINLDTFGLSNGTVDLLFNPGSLSATGLTAKTNLEGKGWTVSV